VVPIQKFNIFLLERLSPMMRLLVVDTEAYSYATAAPDAARTPDSTAVRGNRDH
jgi:hypothetical protein